MKFGDLVLELVRRWKALGEEERKRYQDMTNEDNFRCGGEMTIYLANR